MTGAAYSDASPDYWDDYNNLQWTKHALIGEYLKGWFPKLGFWAGRVVYLDTHAGRGRHGTGHLGSPLIALRTLLEHSHRDAILAKSEVWFSFVERDAENLAQLTAEVDELSPLPPKVFVEKYLGDCEELVKQRIDEFRAIGTTMAPTFAFVDPYGFKVQYSLLRELMTFQRVELFINVMWRHLDMAIRNSVMGGTLDFMFAGPEWRYRVTSDDYNERAEQTLGLIRDKVGARWMTNVRMLAANGAIKYILVHLSNHEAGRDLMKEVMWKVCPSMSGTFVARQSDDPTQGVLLAPEPDTRPLAQWVTGSLRNGPLRWHVFDQPIRESLWLPKHLNGVIRDLRRAGTITATDYQGPFSRKANPLLSLVEASDAKLPHR